MSKYSDLVSRHSDLVSRLEDFGITVSWSVFSDTLAYNHKNNKYAPDNLTERRKILNAVIDVLGIREAYPAHPRGAVLKSIGGFVIDGTSYSADRFKVDWTSYSADRFYDDLMKAQHAQVSNNALERIQDALSKIQKKETN